MRWAVSSLPTLGAHRYHLSICLLSRPDLTMPLTRWHIRGFHDVNDDALLFNVQEYLG
jgi:hypothetical protein